MKQFTNTKDENFTFSSCSICEAQCCNGAKGSFFSQLILQDFELVSKNFPILFLIGELGYLKPVVLLSNGKGHCRHITNMQCTIYDERPSICRVYPLSAHLTNDVYIDLNCPAVNQDGDFIVTQNRVNTNFFDEILIDYQDKYITMHNHFDAFNQKENLEVVYQGHGHNFYKFKKSFEDSYIQLHLDSLKNLDEYYLS